MPNTLPVPSKAALRTLRSLALGTSCTVAFTTGLLTEDRRRRIHAAREVHNNAQKLKSSRKYHSGGGPSTDSFEDQVMRYNDDGFWLAKDSINNIQSAPATLTLEPTIPEFTDPCRKPPSFKISKYQLLPLSKIPRSQPLDSSKTLKGLELVKSLPPSAAPPRGPRLRKVVYKPGELAVASSLDRQRKLAADCSRILLNKGDPSTTEAAALRFFEAFEDGLQIEDSGLVKELTDAAAQLSKACQLESKFDVSERILGIVAGYGPIDEDVFYSLGAIGVVKDLIRGLEVGFARDTEMGVSKLRKAVALYVTKFKERPRTSKSWRLLGETLCALTYRYKLFDLTEAVYWRMERSRGDVPNGCVHHLMAALHKQERHKDVIKYFRRLFANARPDQLTFYATGEIVIESALQLGRLDVAEEALVMLAKMGEDGEMQCSTTWFLKVLGSDWRTHRDISRTRALFERLEPHFNLVAHPRAAYGALIQFCVEAGNEDAARWYYDHRLQKAPPGSVTEQDMRVQGHFAYAKAMRHDWSGVKEDFREMRLLSPDKFEFSASFTPIFKLFAKSHAVSETEEFLRTFIEHQYVTLTPYLSTTMINKYAEAREIDSISRWLDYMTSVQVPADAMFFNAIIYNCRTKWNLSFEETYGLYQKVRKLGGPAAKFINKTTISILRRAAIAGAGGDLGSAVKNLDRLKLDQPLKLSVHSDSVQDHMVFAMTKGEPRRALRIYERAQSSLLPLDAASISIAVKAALQVDPNDIYGAANLLRKPQRDGRDISAAVATMIIHQLSYQCTDALGRPPQVQDVARSIVCVLEDRGVQIPPQMITHTMHTLVCQRQYYQAADFWKSMVRSQKTPSSPDLPTLTVLLRAYVGARDCVGIEWAIQMLSINSLLPDEQFKKPLKSALSNMRKALEGNEYGYFDRRFYNVIKNALRSISGIRFEATLDKESVKAKTIKIIEQAIEIDRISSLGCKVDRVSEGSSKARLADEKSSNSVSERSRGVSSWRSTEETDHNVHLPPVGRLVGVNAG
jgi:hypothetical protein